MPKPFVRVLLVLSAAAAWATAVHGQSRTAALPVQVRVVPSCAISIGRSDVQRRARLTCSGRLQPTVLTNVGDAPAALVRLTPEGRARSTADVALPAATRTAVITIDF